MRSTYLVRRIVFAVAVSMTSSVGAFAITTAASDAPVAGDIDVADDVYRTTPYGSPSVRIDLSIGGGGRGLAYEVVEQPNTGETTIGTASIQGHTATLSIERDASAGPASFTYRATDDGESSDVATVSFEVANRPPLTRDLTLTTRQDAALDIWPYARDAEDGGPFPWTSDGNRITYSNPQHGTIEPFFGAHGNGPAFAEIDHKAVYVPDAGYVGADSFSYTFTDEDGARSTAQISVDVVEPPRRERGERDDVRYRCAVHMRSDDDGKADPDGGFDADLTARVAWVLGGDVVLEVDADVRGPRSLAPGVAYDLGPVDFDLSVQSGATELLTGVAVDDGDVALDSAGFGQSSIGAELSAALSVRTPVRGAVHEAAINGLSVRPRPIASVIDGDGLTLPLAGTTGELIAPRRGAVTVSLPQVFGLSLRLQPGLDGRIETVGLRCYAPGSERLALVRIPIAS